jgi:hypothetical protein
VVLTVATLALLELHVTLGLDTTVPRLFVTRTVNCTDAPELMVLAPLPDDTVTTGVTFGVVPPSPPPHAAMTVQAMAARNKRVLALSHTLIASP